MLLDELNGAEPEWTEDEMKMYMQGVEDNTTVAIFSIKVYYSIEVGEGSSRHFPLSSGKLADMVDRMIDRLNKRFEFAWRSVSAFQLRSRSEQMHR